MQDAAAGTGAGAEPEQAAMAAESVSAVDCSDDSPAATNSLLPAEDEGVDRDAAVVVVQEAQAAPLCPALCPALSTPIPPAPLPLPAVPVEQLLAVFLVLRDMLTMDKDVQDFFMSELSFCVAPPLSRHPALCSSVCVDNAAAVEADLPVAPQGLLLSALGHRSEADEESAGDPDPDPDPEMSALWTLASEVRLLPCPCPCPCPSCDFLRPSVPLSFRWPAPSLACPAA